MVNSTTSKLSGACCLVTLVMLVTGVEASTRPAPRTYCNPLSLPDMPIGHECRNFRDGTVLTPDMLPKWAYGCWHEVNGVKTVHQFRELADPETLVEGNTWYLYPSCGLMWTSDDCGGTWKHVNIREQGEYAPAVAKFRGKYYLTDSYGPLRVADSPTGPFKVLGKFDRKSLGDDPTIASFGDPALLADGDHLYLYWGCVSPSDALWGCELDPDNPLKAKTPARRIVELDPATRPWMRRPLEGAYVFKRGKTYYFTHAGGSPGGYCLLVWKGTSPLGPFVPQKTNPAFVTPMGTAGCITGTGHGSIFQDQFGDWWFNFCVWPKGIKFHGFERFIGQDRIFFDENGDVVLGHGTHEPQWLPSTGKKGPTGWKALPAKTASANAADNELRTYERFASMPGTMTFEFDGVKTLQAYRVIWCDLGLDELRGVKRGPWQYRLERRLKGKWHIWVDASDNQIDLTVDYREAPEKKADAVRITVLDGPRGIAPALTEFTVFGN